MPGDQSWPFEVIVGIRILQDKFVSVKFMLWYWGYICIDGVLADAKHKIEKSYGSVLTWSKVTLNCLGRGTVLHSSSIKL